MSDFATTRTALNQARKQLLDAQSDWYAARQTIARLQEQRAAAARTQTDGDVLGRIDEQIAKARKNETARAETVAGLGKTAGENAGAFASFADPRSGIGQLDDETPILLLPVRLETRFKSVQDQTGAHEQLWVRIYPDECAVDTFEAVLSDTEVESGKRTSVAALCASRPSGTRALSREVNNDRAHARS